MSEEVKVKLETRKKEIEEEFETLKAEYSNLSKRQSEIREKQVQLQGAYQEVEKILELKPLPKKEKKK